MLCNPLHRGLSHNRSESWVAVDVGKIWRAVEVRRTCNSNHILSSWGFCRELFSRQSGWGFSQYLCSSAPLAQCICVGAGMALWIVLTTKCTKITNYAVSCISFLAQSHHTSTIHPCPYFYTFELFFLDIFELQSQLFFVLQIAPKHPHIDIKPPQMNIT